MRRRYEFEGRKRYRWVRGAAALVLGLGIAWGVPHTASAGLPFASGFDDDAFGWGLRSGSVLSYSELDVAGSATSGSARIEVKATTMPFEGFPHTYNLECFPIDPGLTYSVAGWILIPSGQATAGSAQMSVVFYSNGSCGGLPELRNTFALRTPGEWTLVEDPAVVPPATAMSARLGMAVFKNTADVTFEALFDDVRLAPEPSLAVLQAAALAVLALVRRLLRQSRLGSDWGARRRNF